MQLERFFFLETVHTCIDNTVQVFHVQVQQPFFFLSKT